MNSRIVASVLGLCAAFASIIISGCDGIPPNPFDDTYRDDLIFQYDLNSEQWIRTELTPSCNDDGSLSVLVERTFDDHPVLAGFDGTARMFGSKSRQPLSPDGVGQNVGIMEKGTVTWSAERIDKVDTLWIWWAYGVCTKSQLDSQSSTTMCIQERPVMTAADHCTKKQ